MKILFIVSRYYPHGAGSGRSVRNLAEGVAAAGHDAVVACLSPDGSYSESVENDVKIYRLPTRNIYRLGGRQPKLLKRILWHCLDTVNPAAQKDIRKILKRESPDIVNTNVIAGFSSAIKKEVHAAGIPLVHTLRDYYLICPQSGMFRGGKSCETICKSCSPFFKARKHAARNVSLFLANSQHILDVHNQYGALPREANQAVQFNVNDNDDIGPARVVHPFASMRFGYIGRLANTKGLEVLLDAFCKLGIENVSLKIAGVGDPKYVGALQEQYRQNNIEFLGYQDADTFYKNVDVIICPSIYAEPLPRVVFEAYRHGLPVIAARSGGTPEIVLRETGFLYDPHDRGALRGHMHTLAESSEIYGAMSKAAVLKAEEFKRSQGVAQYLEKISAAVKSA